MRIMPEIWAGHSLNNMDKYKYILWDWNGTLLDDIGASLLSVNDMLKKRGMPEIDEKRYRECIGVPIIRFYERVFDLSKEIYNDLLKEYNKGYLYYLERSTLSDGAEEVLESFAKSGKKQVIVSSSNNAILKPNVEKYRISGYFDEILGSDDFMADSKIERAVKYLKSSGASSGETLVIGDLEHDFELAKAIGADCILLTSGHEKPERLNASGAKIIDSLREML